MSSDLDVKNCLKCNYALQGLPEQGSCPECGLEYGNDLVLVGYRSPSTRKSDKLVPILLLVFLSFLFVRYGNFVCAVPFLLCGAWLGFQFYKSNKSSEEIGGDIRWIVNHEGLRVIKNLDEQIPLLPWSQIRTVSTHGNLGFKKRRWRTLVIKRQFWSLDWFKIRGQQIWFNQMDLVDMRELRKQVLTYRG